MNDFVNWDASDLSCALCGDMLRYTDESFILTVVTAAIEERSIHYRPIMLEDGSDFQYEPYFFCFTCWESSIEEVKKRCEDNPPVSDQYGILECGCCESGIRQHETMGISSFGEVRRSRRSSTEGGKSTFEVMDPDPSILCVECLNDLNTIVDELWEGGVTQAEECAEGRFIRCWRYGCSATGEGIECKALCKSIKEAG